MPDLIRILLVDDHAVLRAGLKALLDAEDDLRVVGEAGTGEEAIDKVKLVKPDVVIMDLSMPGMSGLALIREAHVRRPGLPAVLLTGYAGDAAHLAISGAPPGTFSLLRKPVSLAQIVDSIEMVLAAKARSGR